MPDEIRLMSRPAEAAFLYPREKTVTKTFKVKNYKRIDEVEITSGAGLVVLGGKNAQGKSSFLDAIREVVKFVGVRETPEPIRLGQDEADVEIIDHDRDRRYVRTFKRGKTGKVTSTVGVYALDGAKYENASQIIAEDLGAEIIDAAQFAMLGARDQRDTLLRQVDLPFDLDEIARQKSGAEDERKLANADVKRLQGALESLEKPGPDAPAKEVSAAELLEKLGQAQEANRKTRIARLEFEELKTHIADLESKLSEAKDAFAARQEAAATEFIDTAGLEAQIDDIEATNARARAAQQYKVTAAELATAESNAQAKQAKLDALDKQKRDALTAAQFPDPLLSVDDEQVLYDGIPFTQVNSAKQIGIGFDIATLAKRDLKIGFIKNGDLLDDDSLAEIDARAIERGYTILVERGRSGDVGYVFNEGALLDVA